MSMITRCPACSTSFKVVADQLKVSGGWVRCGHCSEVFDAQAHLQGDAEPAPPVSPPESLPADSAEPESASSIPPGLSPEPVAEEVVAASLAADSSLDSSSMDSSMDSSLLGPPSVLPDVSFVRQARALAFWRRPLVRGALALVCLALLTLLALQVAVFERDRIAAMEPRAKPWLQALCQQLGCEIAPLRMAEALVIDSSSFNKLRGDAYRLNVAIKNTAPLELAMPALDLALTDTQDQPVLRRVLVPADFGAPATLAANAEFNGSVALQLDRAQVSGYRVLVFYP